MSSTSGFSRRNLLRGGAVFAAAPLLAGLGRAAPAPMAAERLLVDTRIGGKGPFRFLVDTGADRTVLAAELAAELQLPQGAPVIVQGIAKAVDATTVELEELSLGALRFDRLDAPILPRNWIGADGYLGLDVMDRHRVAFDFAQGTLSLGEPRPSMFGEMARPDETVIHAIGSGGHLRSVDCRVDGVRARAFVDTGAELTVGNPRLFTELAARSPQSAVREPVVLTGVTGGSILGHVTIAKSIGLPGVVFNGDGLVIADLPIFDIWDLADKPALLIGMDVLRGFSKVTIDFGRKEYRFEFASLQGLGLA